MKQVGHIFKVCVFLILHYLVASALAYLIYAGISYLVNKRIDAGFQESNQWLMAIMYALNIFFLIFLFRQNRPAFFKAFHKSPVNVLLYSLYGLIFTTIFIAALYGILFLFTDIQFAYKGESFAVLSKWFVMLYFAAMLEEVLCRNLMLDRLINEKGYNPLLVLITSSLLFSLLHLFNDNFSVIPFIYIVLVGIIFGIVYFKYKNIYLVTAIHFFWNYITGLVLGSHVSGIAMPSVLTYNLSADSLISGGAFGIEGSIILLLLQVLVIAAFTPFLLQLNNNYKVKSCHCDILA